MKRIHKITFESILIFFILNFCFLNRVNAASTSVSGGTVTVGENITVNFSVSDNNGGFSGNVSYDTSKLEYISNVVNGTGSYNNGNIAMVGGSSFSITFRAKSEGNASVSLGNIMLGDGTKANNCSATVVVKPSNNSTSSEPNNSGGASSTHENPPSTSTTPDTNQNRPNSGSSEPEPAPSFKDVNDTVYATKSMNVRSSWTTSSSKIGGLSKNQAVTRTGIGSNGWSRISYNGKTAYVSTALITTTKPQEEEPEETPEETPDEKPEETPEEIPEENSDNPENNENSDEENENEQETIVPKSDEEIYQEIVSKVGTIPEVGKNYNIYIFFAVCSISIISIIFIFRKDLKN